MIAAVVSFSTCNSLSGTAGKVGVTYGNHGGLCLEMCRYADAVMHAAATNPALSELKKTYIADKQKYSLLKKGEQYYQKTVYAFSSR
jgi:galactose mutarotase-like enzyme